MNEIIKEPLVLEMLYQIFATLALVQAGMTMAFCDTIYNMRFPFAVIMFSVMNFYSIVLIVFDFWVKSL